MKWGELIRIAKDNGWVLDRHGGRHDIYSKDGVEYKLTFGRHQSEEVKPGLYKTLIKKITG